VIVSIRASAGSLMLKAVTSILGKEKEKERKVQARRKRSRIMWSLVSS
jgi:hypothetical protein